MNLNHDDPVIDEIREVRRRISKQFDDDPERLVAHYMKLQEQYMDRLLDTKKIPKGGESAA